MSEGVLTRELALSLAKRARLWLAAEHNARTSRGVKCRVQFQGKDDQVDSRWAVVDDRSGRELAACWLEFLEGEVHFVCQGGVTA